MLHPVRAVALTLLLAAPAVAQNPATAVQQQSLSYPTTRTVDVTDRFGAVTVADPYRWLEDINAPETAQWVAANVRLAEGRWKGRA